MSPLRIIFAGTPLFAEVALRHLLASKYSVIAIYTQPDRPKGRGLKVAESPVKQCAMSYNVPFFQPVSLKTIEAQNELASLKPDVMIVAAYGLILPKAVLQIPRFGCINIHPSLLPRFRGAAPIERTIEAGDKETGVTIMQMDEGLDTGDMLFQEHYTIKEDETAGTLHDQLSILGATALLHTLQLLEENKLRPTSQGLGATYAKKISKEEALLSFHEEALTLERKVRAFNPRPVAYVDWHNTRLRIFEAKAISSFHSELPGTLLAASEEGIDIACRSGFLRLISVQLPGGKQISVRDFYHAHQCHLIIGKLFS